MKPLYSYIRDFLREDFHAPYYLSVLAFLGILLFTNYWFHLEPGYLDPLFGTPGHFYVVLGAFSFTYLATFSIQVAFGRVSWRQPVRFWIALTFIFVIIAIDLSQTWYQNAVSYFPSESYWLTLKVLKNASSLFTVIIPLGIFYLLSKQPSLFYGLSLKGFQLKPYVILCLIMLVIIALSTMNSDLSNYYPTYRHEMGTYFEGREWISVFLYELFYGLDFISVEMIFRGFLVIGLAHWLGKEAIIPMVAVYCLLHFGKPYPEAISSIFGGLTLGIFAYKSRTIMGGAMIHICIALGMEYFAWMFK